MRLLYFLGIQFYHLVVWWLAPFHKKARLFTSGRKGLFTSLQQACAGWPNVTWFHCASLGEFEQGRPLMEALKKKDPQMKILLTFFSPSGYQVRRNYEYADHVTYLPADTPANARRFLNMVQPRQVFFIKYEYWYFMLHELHRREIPVYLVSALFREEQMFFKWYGSWFRRMLHFYRRIFVQDATSRDLLNDYHVQHVSVCGDTRFDRVMEIAQTTRSLPSVETFKDDSFLFVGGSTWPPDETLMIRYFYQKKATFKMIIAPHEVDAQNIRRITSQFEPGHAVVWSEASNRDLVQAKVLIVDTIGMLSALYGYGQLAYVGGGFGQGIHNILEAAAHGLPVIFGPNHTKFKEAEDLKEKRGAFAIEDYSSFEEVMDRLLEGPLSIKNAGAIARDYVDAHAGATHHILTEIQH